MKVLKKIKSSKVYGRIIRDRIVACTESQLGWEHGNFQKGNECMDQIFIKYLIISEVPEREDNGKKRKETSSP